MAKAKWSKETYKLPKNHNWQAKDGYQIFVADQGAVRFDIPVGWVFVPGDNSVKFHDCEPPDDNCVLEMSIFRLPPGPDWSQLSLPGLFGEVMQGEREGLIERGEIVTLKRGDLEIVWNETRYIDPGEQREAYSRALMARRSHIQPLITFAFWPEDRARLLPAWDELLRTLRIGEYVVTPIPRGRN